MVRMIILAGETGLDSSRLGEALDSLMEGNIEVVITDPGHMKALNSRFRHVDRPTDVLTFDLADEGDADPEGTIFVDGRLHPPIEELLERILHGYLHLRGYSHDTHEDSVAMAAEVDALVKKALEKYR